MKNWSKSEVLDQIKKIIPNLSSHLHKGLSGKVGVVGGSFEYTGAPYYAAISALKVGVDISHIFCTEGAATPIKSYSPELIVHPVLKEQKDLKSDQNEDETVKLIVEKISVWLKGLHAIVVGPGLGREPFVMKCVTQIIYKIREMNLPLVVDGDGLHIVTNNPSIVQGYPLAVLTPNVAEYGRLLDKLKIPKEAEDSLTQLTKQLKVSIVKKAETDIISDGENTIECKEEGSPRRSGGQGDILSGSIAAFLAWGNLYTSDESKRALLNVPYTLLAGYAGCYVLKNCAKSAFKKHFRSTTAPNIIEEIGPIFETLFPCGVSKL